MEVPAIFEKVLSLFLMILVGFYGSKKKIITTSINKGLIDILIQIALPFMILSSFIFTYNETIKSNVIKTFYYSIAAYIITIFFSYIILLPIKKNKKTILHFSNVFVNTGYIGFPVLYSIYGAEGVVYGSIFNTFFVIFLWTYGLFLFKGHIERKQLKEELLKIVLNPSIIAVCVGLLIMIFNLPIPAPFLSSIKSIGGITGPLSMFIIGVILSNSRLKQYIQDWTLYYGLATKLIIIPAIISIFSLFSGDNSKAIYTIIIMSAMPASAMTAIFAESFDKEKEYAAVFVSFSTLLSLVTITIIIKLIL
ncbi:MAG: permease [Herbinix sp.]|jgi:predicted permease|nr:permease [Herbinix sp.]